MPDTNIVTERGWFTICNREVSTADQAKIKYVLDMAGDLRDALSKSITGPAALEAVAKVNEAVDIAIVFILGDEEVRP